MLVFASGWRAPMAVSAITGLQARGVWGLARLSRRRQDVAGATCGALRYNSGVAEEGGHGSGPLLPVKLDDRAVPYTVPMKAVPAQCGPLGRVRPARRFVRGVHGPTGPYVPVRALPHAGGLVQPLRSRQPLLRAGVLAPGPQCSTA